MYKLVVLFTLIPNLVFAGNWRAKLKSHYFECNSVWLSSNVLITQKSCLRLEDDNSKEEIQVLTGEGTYLTTITDKSLIYPPKNDELEGKIEKAEKSIESLEKNINEVRSHGLTVGGDFNRTEIVKFLLEEFKNLIEPDFVLVSMNKNVRDENPYVWNREVLEIGVEKNKNETLGKFLHAIDCQVNLLNSVYQLEHQDETLERLENWEEQYDLFVNDEFLCIVGCPNIDVINQPITSDDGRKLLGFMSLEANSSSNFQKIALLKSYEKWILEQIEDSKEVVRVVDVSTVLMRVWLVFSVLFVGGLVGYLYKFKKEESLVKLRSLKTIGRKRNAVRNHTKQEVVGFDNKVAVNV